MKYLCNPLSIDYRYQFNVDPRVGQLQIAREAADPSMIMFQGKYYIFASMNLSVWVSDDLVHWESHRLPKNLPLYDYAPDVRIMGDYVYFSASKRGEVCNYYRTKDIINGPYEEIAGTFDFWDPNLFIDDDDRVYFYWGCSNSTPLWGVELDPETMKPLGERQVLISGDPWKHGYERFGADHSRPPASEEEIEMKYQAFLARQQQKEEDIPEQLRGMVRGMFSNMPYIEGAWMDKYQGKYYLQYAFPGTEFNVYGDGVYVGDSPLGPFTLAKNNPYSYKPGGFIPGAGHGSTMWDRDGNLWHTATMRISVNHQFERRVGIWPAGFDADGELFCNQRFGDWPMPVPEGKFDPWKKPDWYLLSYGKDATASSAAGGKGAELVLNENVQNWWQAATNESGQWVQVDLGEAMHVHAVQINFADDHLDIESPGEIQGSQSQPRYIEEAHHVTRWTLEGSMDGEHYQMLMDKSQADTDLPHDLVLMEGGMDFRYVRLTVLEIPYGVAPCVSGLRVFGRANGNAPMAVGCTAVRKTDIDMEVAIHASDEGTPAIGYNILWGHAADKLYHSYMVFSAEPKNIGALVAGQDYYVRIDAFNENGITEGSVTAVAK